MFNGFEIMPEEKAAPWQGTDASLGEMFPSLFAAADARAARMRVEEARRQVETEKREAEITLRLGRKDAALVGAALAALAVGTYLPRIAVLALVATLLLVFLFVCVRAARQYMTIGARIATLGEQIASAREAALMADQESMRLQHEADRKIKVLPDPDEKTPAATTVAAPAE